MKSLIFSAAGIVTSALPLRVRHVLAKSLLNNPSLVREYGYVYLSGLAQKLNIAQISATGQYGTMASCSNDLSILRTYAETGRWAPELFERVKMFFSGSGGTYLDIGANIGMTVVPILEHNSAVTCYAFEPEPANYRNLLLNIHANCPSSDVHAYQFALHEREGMLPFEIADGNLGAHRLHVETDLPASREEGSRRVVEVRCVRLDDLALELRGPVFVKIDTEGAEPFVVAGGRQTLARADAIILEWSPYNMARLGADPTIVLDFLESHFEYGQIEPTDANSGQRGESGLMKDITARLAGTITEWRNRLLYVDVVATRKQQAAADGRVVKSAHVAG
jgi:FkbM family methyltransferase